MDSLQSNMLQWVKYFETLKYRRYNFWGRILTHHNGFVLLKRKQKPFHLFLRLWSLQFVEGSSSLDYKHSCTICHGLIQTALEHSKAEHLQHINDIIVWCGSTDKFLEEREKKKTSQNPQHPFCYKTKVKGLAQEVPFLGIKW